MTPAASRLAAAHAPFHRTVATDEPTDHGGPQSTEHSSCWPRFEAPESAGRPPGELCAGRSPVQNLRAVQSEHAHLPTTSDKHLTPADCRPGLSHRSPLHVAPPRQDHLPDHHLGRPLAADLRPQARTEPRLHHPPADPRGHLCHTGLEEAGLCSMGRPRAQC